MLTRIAAAAFGLALVHGGANTANDAASLAETARVAAPAVALTYCAEHAESCARAIGAAAGLAAPQAGRRAETEPAPHRPATYPLPPQRPDIPRRG